MEEFIGLMMIASVALAAVVVAMVSGWLFGASFAPGTISFVAMVCGSVWSLTIAGVIFLWAIND